MTGVPPKQYGRGFQQTGKLLKTRIRSAGESRGFALTRVLTHWDEVVGPELSRMTRPVKVGYGRKGFGATLTVLTSGAFAPLVQAQLPQLRTRVNACYGYNAVSRVVITQTAPTGFAEGQTPFSGPGTSEPEQDPVVKDKAQAVTAEVANADLRQALSALAERVYTKTSN